MKLLVDVGNTRVKWATLVDGHLSAQRAADYTSWSADEWQVALFDGPRVSDVTVANVAGADCRRVLEAAARQAGVSDVKFVVTTATCAGVRNAYADPRLLGVDRWVAVIGAWHLARGACCVVDVGTAMTLDAVDATGQHLGGFIVPGPTLMVQSLHAGTSNLASHAVASAPGEATLLADNTRDAIDRGCRVALAALVDRTRAELTRGAREPPLLVCTGGAVGEILPYVLSTCRLIPDLVLQGLAWVAHSELEP